MSRVYIDRYTGSIERTDVYRVAARQFPGTASPFFFFFLGPFLHAGG